VLLRAAAAQGTIKVGVLHSLSSTMAISEATLKDTILMLVDEQNKKGGLLRAFREQPLAPAHGTGLCSILGSTRAMCG
jgi:Periplasmic binding protein domain